MLYPIDALIAVIIFALVHVFADTAKRLGVSWHSRLLSVGGGVAIAYVFVDLLPKLSRNKVAITSPLWELIPYFERHVYVMALLGFLLFFIVDRSQTIIAKKSTFFWISLSSYALFNFLVGYAVVDKDNPEMQPLILFAFAMALHYFMNDYSLSEAHGEIYNRLGRWILVASLFLGWLTGVTIELSATAVALISAFIGGGVIMNVTRHELPESKTNSLEAFLSGAGIYTCILLSLGS